MGVNTTKYKQTELGLIPDDWEIKSLNEVCSKITDGTHDTPKPVRNGIPFLTAIHIKPNFIDYSNCYYLEKSVHNLIYKRCNSEFGDVLMVNIGAGVGNSAFVNVNYEFSLKNVALLKPERNKLNGQYLNYCQLFQKDQILNSLSTGGAQPFLSLGQIGLIQIPIPKIEEQTAIANALNDADNFIDSLEKLIEKKKQLKQAALQKLLKPKKDWQTNKLGNIGKVYGGLSGKTKTDFENGDLPYITFMNVMSNTIIDVDNFGYVNIKNGESQNKVLVDDLIFNGSSETPEEVGMCAVLLKNIPNLYLNSFCFGFRLDKDKQNNALFLAYFFRSSEGRKLFYSMAQGATRYNLSKANFLKMEVCLPSLDEQLDIADIIVAMETEIKQLQIKLDKYNQVKLGMMQNLLTGKIRLV